MDNKPKIVPDVLAAIFRLPTATRRSIASYLDSSHVTVGKALQYLHDNQDIVTTDSVFPAGSGRPSDVFSLRREAFYGVGMYFQPGVARAVLIDAGKSRIGEWTKSIPLEFFDPADVLKTFQDVTQWVCVNVQKIVHRESVISFGVSLPGFIDTQESMWRGGLQFGTVRNVDVGAIMKETVNSDELSVTIEDTSRSLTHLQLMKFPETQTASHFSLINLGIGLGAGIVIDGEVFLGNGGIVGEIGHIPLGNSQIRCACGNLGCVETMLSASGIRSVFAERLSQGVRSTIDVSRPTITPPTIDAIGDAAHDGDHFSRSTLFELGGVLGDLVDIIMKVYTPGPLILAGEGSKLAEYMIPAMQQKVETKVLPEMISYHDVMVQTYDDFNEAEGVGMLGMRRALKQRFRS